MMNCIVSNTQSNKKVLELSIVLVTMNIHIFKIVVVLNENGLCFAWI